VDNRYVSPETWYDANNKPFQPQVHYFVGGATKMYGAALYRLRKEDFGEIRHHGGISPAVAGVAHQAGTCRFGSDPDSSVLNTDCRAHELDNLYVVDTSFFPSISAVNPALTAMANALRVGDHLLERLG
jgi:choline dehydrogenase-like flavoprotein